MPRGDRSGPAGAGAMSGRRMGYCSGYGNPGFVNRAFPWQGAGAGFRGGGRGWRHMFYASGIPGWQRFAPQPPTPEEEAQALKTQSSWLKEQLDAISQRIDELEKK